MKKLESLSQSKFELFADSKISNLQYVIGGQTLCRSFDTKGTCSDEADLTDKAGKLYDGTPGDGTAGDWTNIKNCMVVPLGSSGPFQPYDGQDPVGDPGNFLDASSGQVYQGIWQ